MQSGYPNRPLRVDEVNAQAAAVFLLLLSFGSSHQGAQGIMETRNVPQQRYPNLAREIFLVSGV